MIILLLLAGMAYGQSELGEIKAGDLQVFRADNGRLGIRPFSIRYPKSFRSKVGGGKMNTVGFYRWTSPLYITVRVLDIMQQDDSIAAYSDTSTIRHYHTSWKNAPQLLTDSVDTIHGRTWQYYEYTSQREERKGQTYYYKYGIYSYRDGTYLMDVAFVIALNTDAAQTAEVFERYKGAFRKEMETFEFTTAGK